MLNTATKTEIFVEINKSNCCLGEFIKKNLHHFLVHLHQQDSTSVDNNRLVWNDDVHCLCYIHQIPSTYWRWINDFETVHLFIENTLNRLLNAFFEILHFFTNIDFRTYECWICISILIVRCLFFELEYLFRREKQMDRIYGKTIQISGVPCLYAYFP